jgi:2-polyprenyl-6-methoxyphenol hydroxylase-like FAD-dependent oxidoreductase
MSLEAFQGGAGDLAAEIPRAMLAAILLDAGRDNAEFLWGDTITSLKDRNDSVEVSFGKAPERRFSLVVGADGLHSEVRRLTFGPDEEFTRHMGMYVAALQIDKPFGADREVTIYNTPGRAVSVHPTQGHAVAALIFRRGAVPGYRHQDMDLHKRLVIEAFAGAGWRVPELLGRVRECDDLYFDSVSQVRLPQWSRGRVAVVGDAASRGGDSDPRQALDRYEAAHRAVVAPKLNGYRLGAAMLLPATRSGITTRNIIARTIPALTAASSLRRKNALA